jgi:hypothetical protein
MKKLILPILTLIAISTPIAAYTLEEYNDAGLSTDSLCINADKSIEINFNYSYASIKMNGKEYHSNLVDKNNSVDIDIKDLKTIKTTYISDDITTSKQKGNIKITIKGSKEVTVDMDCHTSSFID